MTDSDILTVAQRLQTASPQRIWGLSPASVYTALAAKTAHNQLHDRLSPHIRAEKLRTNDERSATFVAQIHDWVLGEFGLWSDGQLTILGAFVLTSSNPEPLIRTASAIHLESAETVLRSCADAEGSLPHREFESLLADTWDEALLAPLLGSLGFVTIYPDSVEPHLERIESVFASKRKLSTQRAAAEAYTQSLPALAGIESDACLTDVVDELVGVTPNNEHTPSEIVASLSKEPPAAIDNEDIQEAIAVQHNRYEQQFNTLRSLLVPGTNPDVTIVEENGPAADNALPADAEASDRATELLRSVVATVAASPEFATFDTAFITERVSLTPYSVYQLLSAISGVECEVTDFGLIEFESVPTTVSGNDLREEYTTHLVDRCSTARERMQALADISVTTSPEAMCESELVAQDFESLRDGDFAPTYFTYTLIDPDALGEKKMDDYVGDSRALGQERARLRRWHQNRPPGLKSYTAMTDRLFSLGLERDLDQRVLRIMTPFDDDTFNQYVAQIRRLLEHGFEFRLLTRHTKKSWEWQRLQRNLLSEIKEHRDQVTIRTYSRFKEHQRVTADMDFSELSELGIHGKLHTIGDAEEGAALLGSANFMENSYDWNPECGVYTERSQFVAAAIEFFDIVWDISAADELDIDRLQEIPNRRLVPTYYS